MLLLAICLAQLLISNSAVQDSPASKPAAEFRVLNQFASEGDAGFDYITVDAQERRLYIAHSNRVMVMNADTGAPLGQIAGTPGVHGVALVPKLHLAFISNGADRSVLIADSQSLKTLGKVTVGENPDAILYDAWSNRVVVFNGGSRNATVIEPVEGKGAAPTMKTVPLGGKPEFAVSDGEGKIFVNIENTNEIVEIDTQEWKVVRRIALATGRGPTGLALDAAHHMLFSACSNRKMIIVDAIAGKVVGDMPIGAGADGCAFDPATGRAFASNSDGTLSVVMKGADGRWTTAETVKTAQGARTIAYDPNTKRLFVAAVVGDEHGSERRLSVFVIGREEVATKPIIRVAADGYPTGQDTPEGAAVDLARAFIRRDAALFRKTCIPAFGPDDARKQYKSFIEETAQSMVDEAKRSEPSPGGPKSIEKVFAVRSLSADGPASYGFAVLGLEAVQFVDVIAGLHGGGTFRVRNLVLKHKGRWFVDPAPELDPLLSSGLNQEAESTVEFRQVYQVEK